MSRVQVRVDLNSSGMREMLNDGMMDNALGPVADRVAANARGSAPVETGAYQSSIGVEVDNTDRRRHMVVADIAYALEVEAATGNLVRALTGGGGVTAGVGRVRYTTLDGRTIMATQTQAAAWMRSRRVR